MDKKNAQDILDELDETLEKIEGPELKTEIARNKKSLRERIVDILLEEIRSPVEIREAIIKTQQVVGAQFVQLVNAIKAIRVDIPKRFTVNVENEVKISNLKDIPKPVLKVPDSVEVRRPPWIDEFALTPISKAISQILIAIKTFKWPKDADEAIPVRLSDGKKFYEAITQFFNQGGGGSVPRVQSTVTPAIHAVPVVNPDGTNVSGGSGGGAVTIADGADVAEGAVADAVVAAGATGTVSAKLRRLTTDLDALIIELQLKADVTETQPVSAASLPLPTGASTAANQSTANTSLSNIDSDTSAIQAAVQIMDDWDNGASDGASVSGDVAHAVADVGEPVKIGGRADTTFQAAVTDGQRVDALFDVYGHLRTRTDHANNWSYHENSGSALTDASVQAAPGTGLSIYVTDIVVSTGAATAFNVFFEEGASTVLGPYYLEATAGRGLVLSFKTPKKITANTALTITTSAAIAHGIDITGFIAP